MLEKTRNRIKHKIKYRIDKIIVRNFSGLKNANINNNFKFKIINYIFYIFWDKNIYYIEYCKQEKIYNQVQKNLIKEIIK